MGAGGVCAGDRTSRAMYRTDASAMPMSAAFKARTQRFITVFIVTIAEREAGRCRAPPGLPPATRPSVFAAFLRPPEHADTAVQTIGEAVVRRQGGPRMVGV